MNTAIVTGSICITALVVVFLILQYHKTLKMLEADKTYKKYDPNQQILQEGVARNRWDLSYFPALSRIFFKADWKIILACMLLIFFIIIYAILRENTILDLIKVNFGAIIGALVGSRETGQDR